jgi:hypothetical protein
MLGAFWRGFRFRLLDRLSADPTTWPSHFLTPAQLRLTPTPALVVDAQGGITLGLEQGELGAEFPNLGTPVKVHFTFSLW